MNKISKKIVALATMAAFVLTLVPAAAFAADASTYKVENVAYNQAKVTIDVSNTDANAGYGNILVWAEKDGKVCDEATYSGDKTNSTYPNGWTDANGDTLYVGQVVDQTVTIDFSGYGKDAADYVIYVALNKDAKTSAEAKANALVKNGVAFHADGMAMANASDFGAVVGGTFTNEASVAVDTDLTAKFYINDNSEDATADTLKNVVVWVKDNSTQQLTKVAKIDKATGMVDTNGYKIGTVGNGDQLKIQFGATGNYTIYAGNGATLADAQKNPIRGSITVDVTDDTTVESIDNVQAKIYTKNANGTRTLLDTKNLTFNDSNTAVLKLTDVEKFRYNGIDEIDLSGIAKDENGKAAKKQTINFTTTREDVIEFVNPTTDAHNDSDYTENDGVFETTFTMQDAKNGIITITDAATGLEYSIRVIAVETTAVDINRTLTGGYVLAGTDSNWDDFTNRLFTDAVQFEVLNDKNEKVTGHIDGIVIDVDGQPAGATLTGADFELVDSGNGVYTLMYVNPDETKLIPGKYEVRVALPGVKGDEATVTFTAAKFGKAQDTVLDVFASDHNWTWGNPNEEIMTVDDQITLGQTVGVVAQYVDANGIKIKADDVTYGFNGGLAVVDPMPKDGFFSTPADIPANQSLLGTEIEIVAFNTAKHQLVTKTLTVVPSYTDKSLEFDPVQGPTNEDNKVTVSVVDENGKVQQVEGTLDAWVADQSNEDAKVSVDVNNKRPHDVQDGKGSLTVYSDQETTADITVVVKAGNEAYYGTLEYTFGAEDPLADYTVVMTIDSTEYVVNNNVITGDAAPYIDDAWRTMVPIRALMEAFDAEVVWDEENPDVVTINFDGDTQIVMNVGDEAYTINGVDGEMDTVPVNNNGRVYVPIRFVAEGIGFHVTPLYNADGLTASVVFQR